MTIPRLVGFLRDAGVAGLVANGLASESWTFSAAERNEINHAIVRASDGLPVTIGVDGPLTDAFEAGTRALALGASSLMVRPPSGMETSALAEHYHTLANTLDVDILVQDARRDAAGCLAPDDIRRICDSHARLRWVKVDEPHPAVKVRLLTQHGLQVVTGWGGVDYPLAHEAGALGCMPASDLAPQLAQLHRALERKDSKAATSIYGRLQPLLAFQGQSLDLFISSSKHTLHRAGILQTAQVRRTVAALTEPQLAELEALLVSLEHATPKLPGLRDSTAPA